MGSSSSTKGASPTQHLWDTDPDRRMRRGGLKTHRNEVKRQGITSATSSEVRDALKDPEILLLLTVLEKLSHVRKGVCDKRAPRSTVCKEESESNWIPAHVQVAPRSQGHVPTTAVGRFNKPVARGDPPAPQKKHADEHHTGVGGTWGPHRGARGEKKDSEATCLLKRGRWEPAGPAPRCEPGPRRPPSTGPQHRAPAHRTLLPRWSSDPVPRTGRPTREDGPFPSAQADLPCPHSLHRDDPR